MKRNEIPLVSFFMMTMYAVILYWYFAENAFTAFETLLITILASGIIAIINIIELHE